MIKNSKGFTLIELLVVIAIIAVLAVAVILTLNPAELLKQARDSTRLSDLSTLKSGLSLYLADVTIPNLATSTDTWGGFTCTSGGTCYDVCYLSTPTQNGTGTTRCGDFDTIQTVTGNSQNVSATTANLRRVDGRGWIPVKFTDISSGSPLGNLPVDPTNSTNYYYAYIASGTGLTFEIDARVESLKYGTGASNVLSTDGGNKDLILETGTAPGLTL